MINEQMKVGTERGEEKCEDVKCEDVQLENEE